MLINTLVNIHLQMLACTCWNWDGVEHYQHHLYLFQTQLHNKCLFEKNFYKWHVLFILICFTKHVFTFLKDDMNLFSVNSFNLSFIFVQLSFFLYRFNFFVHHILFSGVYHYLQLMIVIPKLYNWVKFRIWKCS